MVEITCPRWQRARHDGLITHERPADLLDDVVLVQGIPCMSVERTLFDIAALGRTRTLELAIDSALRRELTSVDSLVHTGKRLCRRGRIGSALFRAAVATREQYLFELVVANGALLTPENAPTLHCFAVQEHATEIAAYVAARFPPPASCDGIQLPW